MERERVQKDVLGGGFSMQNLNIIIMKFRISRALKM